jgi:hypothetical protein
VTVVCYQVEVFAAERSLVQRRTAECDVSVSDLETSTMMQPRHTRAAEQIIIRKNNLSCVPHNGFYCKVGNKSIKLVVCGS